MENQSEPFLEALNSIAYFADTLGTHKELEEMHGLLEVVEADSKEEM